MPTADVEVEITLLAEGGDRRQRAPRYRTAHKIREDYLTTGVHDYIGCDEVLPGQTVRGTITFITPECYSHCLWVGRVVDIQEGSRVVGRARITRNMNELLESDSV